VRLRILGSRLDLFAEVDKQEALSLENIRLNLIQECGRFRRNYFHRNFLPSESIKQNLDFKIYIRELEYPEISPQYQASMIVEDLQKRTPFRRTIRFRTVQASRIHKILGIRIQISGRLGGAEIARTEWTREGQVPLHTILAHLDYSSQAANTIYGLLGVKVWIFTKKHL
jgi:ribosomal protein S3